MEGIGWILGCDWMKNDGSNNPEKYKYVLCFYPQKEYGCKIQIDYNERGPGEKACFSEQGRWGEVSHWMPLPKEPM